MSYKIISNLASIPVHHQLKVHDNSTCGSASHKFRQLKTKFKCYRYSFLPETIVSWNTLPLEFLNYRHWNSFNMRYRKSQCHHFCIDEMEFLSIMSCLRRDFLIIFLLAFSRIVCAGGSTLKLIILHIGMKN